MSIKNIRSATMKKRLYQVAAVGTAAMLIAGYGQYQNVCLENAVESTFVWEPTLFNGVYVSTVLIEDIDSTVLKAFIEKGNTEFMYMNPADRMTCSYKYSEELGKWCALWSDPEMDANVNPQILEGMKGLPVSYSYNGEKNAVVPEQTVEAIFTKKGDIYFSSLPPYMIDDKVLEAFLKAGNTDFVYRYPYTGTVTVSHYSEELGRWNQSVSNEFTHDYSHYSMRDCSRLHFIGSYDEMPLTDVLSEEDLHYIQGR